MVESLKCGPGKRGLEECKLDTEDRLKRIKLD